MRFDDQGIALVAGLRKDAGALVQRLYGHPSERLARERIKRATGSGGRTNLSMLRTQDEAQ
jgi:hypothetical protein